MDVLRGVTQLPAVLNDLSAEAEEAGMQKIFFTTKYKLGNVDLFDCHHYIPITCKSLQCHKSG